MRDAYLAFGTPDFTEAEIDAVARVMRSGWVGMGQETLAFETELGAFIGVPEVVTVNSCTSALFLALLVEGIGPGDEVIVPSLTWCATANAALYLGATPVFCDVDPYSMCVTPQTVAAKVTGRTRAVVVVHYGGYAVDVEALRASLPADVILVEDAAHALGAMYGNGRPVGASGHTVCFSFYANKNVSTAEGGALALFDPGKAERLRRLRMNGLESHAWSRYIRPSVAFAADVTELGYKANFTDLQAAIGRVQLSRLPEMAHVRLMIAERYRERLDALGIEAAFQQGVFDRSHARHLLVVRFDPARTMIRRDDLLLALRARNIGASIHYRPLHGQPLYSAQGVVCLPVTEFLADTIMTLPISAKMTLADVDYVVGQLACLLNHEKVLQ
ncbi:DegT/DnrJ/EryC1/StrS family aminotransferase [Haematospirillum jordaniae]|uniref:DegT/DnrJ/EryC1/StrS family aminotransferase n=1 Tax=Haematospirillum jordaniae TaxID=1549855 RepID=UPI001432DB08|nr:DegT/DnrJ/EryC1/StrS family aminotransferase [Haematospirillum jordaniae]NKD85345.1 DegT/DnrJ/EryC1/StrS family aminotransferase [Haematospirillum jordaniae]